MKVPARGLCPVPDLSDAKKNPSGVDLASLSVVADAVSTPYRAISRSGMEEGDLAVFVVTAEIPGITPTDLDLTVREDTLTIQGRRPLPVEADGIAWHQRERGYGGFSRTIALPFAVDPDEVDARFANGVLEIELRRPAEDRPRKIEIKAA